MNITTQPVEINYKKPEVIAFVVNSCVNITTKTLIFKSKKDVSVSGVIALFILSSHGVYFLEMDNLILCRCYFCVVMVH